MVAAAAVRRCVTSCSRGPEQSPGVRMGTAGEGEGVHAGLRCSLLLFSV